MEDKPKLPETKIEVDRNIELRNKKSGSRVLIKVIILNVVNLILIAIIFVLLNRLPGLGESLKEMRSARLAAEGKSEALVLRAEIDRNREKIETLKSLYASYDGVVSFIEAANSLRDEGYISDIIFSGDPVTNNKKQLGVPISLTFRGSKDQINQGLERFYALPVLFSISNAELEEVPLEEGGSTHAFRLNIFVLVNEDFSTN